MGKHVVEIEDGAWALLVQTREHIQATTFERPSVKDMIHRGIFQFCTGQNPDSPKVVAIGVKAVIPESLKGRLEDLARGDIELGKLARASQKAGTGSDEDLAYDAAADAWRAKFTPFCEEMDLDEERGMDRVREMRTKLESRQAAL